MHGVWLRKKKDLDKIMEIDSLDALFDVDVTDFFSFPDNEEVMDKKIHQKSLWKQLKRFIYH